MFTCLHMLTGLCCTLVCHPARGPNLGCLQYNERCDQIMEDLITPVCSSRWVRITSLIDQVLQRDMTGRLQK